MQVECVQLPVAYPIATGRFQDTYMHKVQHRGDVARYVSQLHGTPRSIQTLVHWEVQRLPGYLRVPSRNCRQMFHTVNN